MMFPGDSPSKRIVAFLLIALIGLCLGVEDMLVPGACEEDRSAPLAQQQPFSFISSENTEPSSLPEKGDDSHDCLCCCRHLLTARSFQPVHSFNSSILPLMPAEIASSITPQPPYHPPRA